MRINELALAIMLLAGAAGVSSAKAAELSMTDSDSTGDTAVESAQPESPAPDAPVVSHDSGSSTEAPVVAAPSESAQEPAVIAPVQPEHPLSAINQTTRASAEPDPAVITEPTSEADAAQKNAPAKDAQPLFTPEQEARIGELAKAYLLDHPELLIEVDQILQKKQYDEQIKAMTQAVLQHQDALLKDDNIPSIGPAEAKVVLIEFFDYQCNISSHQAPVIRALMKNHPEVRFVFREWPIFGYRWKPSFQAAETGLRIWQQKGADAYMKFHDTLFNTGHVEGALTQADIAKAASAAGAAKLKGKNDDMLDTLARTDALAQNLGFPGTPGIIVIPVSGATADNVTVFPGGTTEELLTAAIAKASQ